MGPRKNAEVDGQCIHACSVVALRDWIKQKCAGRSPDLWGANRALFGLPVQCTVAYSKSAPTYRCGGSDGFAAAQRTVLPVSSPSRNGTATPERNGPDHSPRADDGQCSARLSSSASRNRNNRLASGKRAGRNLQAGQDPLTPSMRMQYFEL